MTFLLALAFALPANDFHVVLNRRIGPYQDYLHGKYAQSVQAFGRPSSRGTTYQSNICTVRWGALGLDMDFVVDLTPCKDIAQAGWYGATFYVRRWTADRGLRVGDTVTRMRKLYPHAKLKDAPPTPPTWTLATVDRAELGKLPILSATTWGGRVTSITVRSGTIF
jgi:hypothetical protein